MPNEINTTQISSRYKSRNIACSLDDVISVRKKKSLTIGGHRWDDKNLFFQNVNELNLLLNGRNLR